MTALRGLSFDFPDLPAMASIQLSEEALFRLHPTAVCTDRELVIESFGPLAAQYAPSVSVGRPFSDFFNVLQRATPIELAKTFGEHSDLALIAKGRGIELGSKLVATRTGFLFVMRPAIDPFCQPEGDLHIADFPAGDPLVQSMMQVALLQCLRSEAESNARDLKLAWEETAEILAQVRRVTGFVSHEFSNLLSIIELNSERMPLSARAGEDALMRSMTMIHEAAKRGTSMARSLRALSGGTDLLQRESLDSFLRSNLPLLEALCRPGVLVSEKLAAGVASIDASAADLLNCLIKIVRDLTLSREGVHQVSIETRQAHLIAAGKPMIEIRVAVEPFISIDRDKLLTDRFRSFLSHETAKASIDDFVRSNGGDVRWETVGQTKTAVTLVLPCVDEAPDAKACLGSAEQKIPAQDRSIVVVEDEPAALEALVELLEFEGYTILPCSDAKQALDTLATQPASVLVTDVVLPAADGLELARAATGAYPSLHVVIMSGHVPDPSRYDRRWAFVQKPLNLAQLIAAIEGGANGNEH